MILQSNILKVGTKFRVTDETTDTTFPPGSLGYIAAAKGSDRDYENVLFMYATIIRRGKTGKDRMEMASISLPIFDLKDDALNGKMPDEKRRNYIHIEPIKSEYKSVHEMPDMDYLGWANANACYLKLLANKASRVKVWNEDLNTDYVARLYRAREYFEQDFMELQSWACVSAGKQLFINRARHMESSLIRCAIPYKIKVAELELNAVKFLMNSGIKHDMKETLDICQRKLRLLSKANAGKAKKVGE